MLNRRTSGSVVCPSCGSLVGVRDEKCYTCGRANPGLWGFAPLLRQLGADFGFIPLTIATNVLLYVIVLAVTANLFGSQAIGTLSPNFQILAVFGASGGIPVFGGERWWTLLTASWLHAGPLHILFNMMAVRNLTPAANELLGPARTIIIYVLSGVSGFLLTSVLFAFVPAIPFLGGASTTVGASASIAGLIGAITHYGHKTGSSLIRAHTGQWALMLIVSGLLLPGVDNGAHLGGFLGGYALSAFLNPLRRERGDHMLVAFVCLAASALALAYALWRGFAVIIS